MTTAERLSEEFFFDLARDFYEEQEEGLPEVMKAGALENLRMTAERLGSKSTASIPMTFEEVTVILSILAEILTVALSPDDPDIDRKSVRHLFAFTIYSHLRSTKNLFEEVPDDDL